MSEAHPGLSLRTRLMIGLAVVAAIAIGVAVTVTVTTHSYLVQQLDARLESYSGQIDAVLLHRNDSSSDVIVPLTPPGSTESSERPSDAYTGLINATDGSYGFALKPNTASDDTEPDLSQLDVALFADGQAFSTTVDALGGEAGEYRVLVRPFNASGGTYWSFTALSMDSVQDATTRLVVIEAFGIGALLAGLALVGLWVIRLGITPMRRMVDASKQIAEGDMSVRLEGASAGSESHDLAIALNGMIGRLQASLTERERSEAKLREFVADASHELRTPLTTVLGYAQLYRKGALSDKADVDDAWVRTESEAGRMKRLVEDMLELAKYDALPELQRVDADITALAAEIVGDSAAADPDTEFALEADGPAIAAVDADKVRQAVINIVRNAAIHGGDNVTVRVTTTSGAVRIAVEDDGPGMSPEVAARATERFVRGDSSRSRATGGGAGLGLAITAAIVDAHGGTLNVTSTVGHGTTVTMTIPRAPLTTGATPIVRTAPSPASTASAPSASTPALGD
ncbi:HAMP domain-containing sensor histidine kinase [Demequina capsici]|uniref:histidine kinase n=1 Tax=Demequina capsici TaxID=3075620 RepID=A0AA96F9Y2_9MICO|nr:MULTISPECIES: HAMP domain-containing sensor histidine kinase [unclassified Demequina]WNM24320.1 HAMP domain-containing sensor histidine kinase [Demequina sp. OYTSA14]WNM27142.1 HAMP domain-containing sensor histidine kinase [Demequina sp. PMTSA13]